MYTGAFSSGIPLRIPVMCFSGVPLGNLETKQEQTRPSQTRVILSYADLFLTWNNLFYLRFNSK